MSSTYRAKLQTDWRARFLIGELGYANDAVSTRVTHDKGALEGPN